MAQRSSGSDKASLSDASARAVLEAILGSDVLGVALLRGSPFVHVMVNERYQWLVGEESALGRPIEAVLPPWNSALPLIAEVASTGRPRRVRGVPLRVHRADGEREDVFVSITYLRAKDPEGDGIVVLVEDVTAEVHDRLNASFVTALATEVASSKDTAAGIRGAVKRTTEALGAQAASLFVVDSDRRRLHGALVGWDWTRTSFVAELDAWPTVGHALATGLPAMITARDAAGAEAGWFESRGIGATLCVPMRAEPKALGVLFFDFRDAPELESAALDLAASVAAHCAATLAAIARGDGESASLQPS